ncbi:MAG: aminotransferase class I/II-fold pyridoxal phosphate-dependent enzyme [Methylococcaceae bacterium]|nr:aminotransferase class I/II-fold pyridoxal phosphate-dependent enzyme [Methylococcaceae bacterium]
MSLDKLESRFTEKLISLQKQGVCKGHEKIITCIKPASKGFGPRYQIDGYAGRSFLRMNSNSYLGMSMHPSVIKAETEAAHQWGTSPGAVRFISGSYLPHKELESKLAEFHGRESAMLFSAAYATMMGVLPQLISEDTLVVSDELNHSCIINAMRLAQPPKKEVYAHANIPELENLLQIHSGQFKRVCVVTDGVFSMRGDHAQIDAITACCRRYEARYEEGIISVVDDSHGVGAFGASGRGTEEITGGQADILVGTLGKALGVNGGYVVARAVIIDYLRETSPFYIYSNPIAPAEAAAARAALNILDSQEGLQLLEKLRHYSIFLRTGLERLGFETLPGEHPIVPLFVRDSHQTAALAAHLFAHNILVTGLNHPVVPRGQEEIRLQISAEHTEQDLRYLLDILAGFRSASRSCN